MVDDPQEADEEAHIATIVAVMKRALVRDYAPGATKRDAHPKHHGLLEATFTVEPNLPAELAVGVFREPRAYRAWLRSSSASSKPKPDGVKDIRGLAIKLLDVDGDKLPESDEPRTQDFVLVSIPTMPLGTLRLFRDAVYWIAKSPLLFAAKMLLTGQLRVVKELAAARAHQSSPLAIRYWSTTPYRLGDRAVKYSLLPTSGLPTALPPVLSDAYLADAMAERLATASATFDFAVQLQKDGMPLGDAAVPWDEAVSPFVKVATVTIPAQVFRTPERAALAEALSFSPAHARTEHRPLGSINRARMRIYRVMSDFRHERAGIARQNQG